MIYTAVQISKVGISMSVQVALIGSGPKLKYSTFTSQRTGFLMNNTYPITGGSSQHWDPTGSMPLTCCAVQLKRNSGKASGQF